VNFRFHLIFLICTIALTSGCSKAKELNPFSNKEQAIVYKALEEITPTLTSNKVWEVNTTNPMGSNKLRPYLDTKAIYVAGETVASAWEASSGKVLWETEISEIITAGINGTLLSNPQRGSPEKSVAEQIFIGTNSGNAIALNAQTGNIQWIERLSSEILAVSSSDNGRVIFRTVDGKLHGLASESGELIWQHSHKTPSLTQLGAGVPIVVSNLVITGLENGKVIAYNIQTGQLEWENTLALPSGNSDIEQIVDVDGKLKALGNALFASSLNGSITGINMVSGKQVWSRAFSSSTGIEASSKALFSSDDKGNVWAFDPQSGNPLWNLPELQGRQPLVPTLVNGSTLVIPDTLGNIHFINADTSKFVARKTGDRRGYSVEPVVSGNSIYLIGRSGLLSKYSL